jgi:hypothetical protein
VKGSRRSALWIVAIAVLAALAGGCSSDESVETQTQSSSDSATPSVAPPNSTPAAVPTEISDLPNGSYRTQLSTKRLQELGVDDPSNAGIWTLTVKSGTYRLECRVIADPGTDCGNHDPDLPPTVELGTVLGSAPTVWFVHDMARLARVTGCVRHTEDLEGCGPEGGYHLDWRTVPHGIAFSNYVGLGDEAGPVLGNWVGQPWTRISS